MAPMFADQGEEKYAHVPAILDRFICDHLRHLRTFLGCFERLTA
jgi:hypothetical protein